MIEIATRGAGWTRDESPDAIGSEQRVPPPEMVKGNRDAERIRADTWPEPVESLTPSMRFKTLHHITAIGDDIHRTSEFLHHLLGMRLVKRTSNFDMPDSFHWYWGVGAGEPGTVVTYFERTGAERVRPGAGQAEHYALSVADRAGLEAVRDGLAAAGHPVSDIRDGAYFASIATRDPDGQVVEIATLGPGFTVDESAEDLGRALVLPPGLKGRRSSIEAALRPLTTHQGESV